MILQGNQSIFQLLRLVLPIPAPTQSAIHSPGLLAAAPIAPIPQPVERPNDIPIAIFFLTLLLLNSFWNYLIV